MVANWRTLTWLSWALVVLAVISAAVTLLFVTGTLRPAPPEGVADFVDRLQFMRGEDEKAYPFVVVGSLATLGVYLIGALLGLMLRGWTPPTGARDAMTLLLVFGGLIGIASQLLNIGAADAARPFLCDCGYRAEEMVSLQRALEMAWSMINWMTIGAVTFVGIGVALAGRVVQVSDTWRLLSYVIAAGVLIEVALRVLASLVFIEAFDPFQVSDLIVAVAVGILVPIWAVLLARGISVPVAEPVAAA
jgi:hypothetical protein